MDFSKLFRMNIFSEYSSQILFQDQQVKAPANRANMLVNIWNNMLDNMWARYAIQYFSKQKATNTLGFSFIRLLTIYQELVCYTIFLRVKNNQHSWIFNHSLVYSLSRKSECEAAAYLIIVLVIDDDDTKTRDSTRKWIRRREEEEMYTNHVQKLLVEDIQGDDENELRII